MVGWLVDGGLVPIGVGNIGSNPMTIACKRPHQRVTKVHGWCKKRSLYLENKNYMSVRTKVLKKQWELFSFSEFMSKSRFISSYRLKKAFLGVFLTLVVGYVGFNLSLQLPKVEIRMNGGFTVENRAQAKFERPEDIVEVKELTIEEKIAKTFPENPKIMIAVAKAESGLNPLATNRNTNGSRDIGLFQINSVHGGDDLELFDVDKNLKVAREVYDKQGITAWSAVNNGSYLKFLKQ